MMKQNNKQEIQLKNTSQLTVLQMNKKELGAQMMDLTPFKSVKKPSDIVLLSKEGKTVGLSYYKRELGEKFTLGFIYEIILKTCKFLNLNNNMEDEQIKMTSELILEEFYWLTPPDLYLWRKRFLSGKYGQLYGRLDGQLILESIRTYGEERMNQAEEISMKEHDDMKNSILGKNKRGFETEEEMKEFYQAQAKLREKFQTQADGQEIKTSNNTTNSLREKFGTDNINIESE